MAAKSTTENVTAESENEETTKNDESEPNDEEQLPEVCSLPETRFDALTVSLAVADTAACLQKRHLYECLYTTINSKVKTVIKNRIAGNQCPIKRVSNDGRGSSVPARSRPTLPLPL